jgi:hypothetical protein
MPEDKQPITDVEQPGKTTPPTTSKPVIVGNRPLLKDPMMVDEDKQPKSDQKAEAKPVDEKLSRNSAGPAKLEPLPDSPKPEAPINDPSVPAMPTEAEAANEKDQPVKKKPGEAVAAESRLKHQSAIEKLADSRQYVLPINTVERRRNRRAILIGGILALILILAWLDIALDAGLIRLGGLQPITNFFPN